MYVNGPKKQHFELLKDGPKEELHIWVHIIIMSLVTTVIMPVKLFIYIATQISSLLRTVINILKEEYGTISVAILHGTAVFKKLDNIGK